MADCIGTNDEKAADISVYRQCPVYTMRQATIFGWTVGRMTMQCYDFYKVSERDWCVGNGTGTVLSGLTGRQHATSVTRSIHSFIQFRSDS